MSDNMTAYVAEASGNSVLLDKDGALWVELKGSGNWTYITDGDSGDLPRLAWDVRDRLPVDYEPYALDALDEVEELDSLIQDWKLDNEAMQSRLADIERKRP